MQPCVFQQRTTPRALGRVAPCATSRLSARPTTRQGLNLAPQRSHVVVQLPVQRSALAPARKPTTACRAASAALDSAFPLHPPKRWWSLASPWDAEIASVALPALCAMLMEPIVGAINSAFVGQIGTFELGAVSIGSLAISFMTFLFSFLLFLTIPEVAAAVATGSKKEVSRVATKGMWVAAGCGLASCIGTLLFADAIVNYLRPPEPAVAKYAAEFIRVRAFGIIPALIAYVATAVFRGHKDTRTPLFGAITSAVCSLSLNALFLHVMQWGVLGSALASTLASTLSCAVLCGMMVSKGMVRTEDLLRPPTTEAVLPMLRAAVPLTLRNVVSFGMILYASSLCVRAGSVYQASFEVIRQVWLLSIQFFECLNVATQVLCAAYLGSGDVDTARAVMMRIMFLGVIVASVVGVVITANQAPFALSFTSDPAVIAQVMVTLPMVALMLPMDAIASIMDGSLMAAKQTDWLSLTQIVAALFQFGVLMYVAQNNLVHCLSIWACLKLLTVFRVAGGWVRNFASADSAYMRRQPVAAAATTATAAAVDAAPAMPAAQATGPSKPPAMTTSRTSSRRKIVGGSSTGGSITPSDDYSSRDYAPVWVPSDEPQQQARSSGEPSERSHAQGVAAATAPTDAHQRPVVASGSVPATAAEPSAAAVAPASSSASAHTHTSSSHTSHTSHTTGDSAGATQGLVKDGGSTSSSSDTPASSSSAAAAAAAAGVQASVASVSSAIAVTYLAHSAEQTLRAMADEEAEETAQSLRDHLQDQVWNAYDAAQAAGDAGGPYFSSGHSEVVFEPVSTSQGYDVGSDTSSDSGADGGDSGGDSGGGGDD